MEHENQHGRPGVVQQGRPVQELSDHELEQQGKNAHDTRNWVFLNGTAEQFATHTTRMLELEQEYLRRHPKRTWQGSGGAPDRAADVDVLKQALRGIVTQLEALLAHEPTIGETEGPEPADPADALLARIAAQRGTDAPAGGAPGCPRGRARTVGARTHVHRGPAAPRHRAAGTADHRRRPRPVGGVRVTAFLDGRSRAR